MRQNGVMIITGAQGWGAWDGWIDTEGLQHPQMNCTGMLIMNYRHLKHSKCRERLSLNFPHLTQDISSKRNSTHQGPSP